MSVAATNIDLANGAQVTAWLTRVRELPNAVARAEIAQTLKYLAQQPHTTRADLIKNLLTLDDQTRPILLEALRGYLRNPGMARSIATTIGQDMEATYRALLKLLHGCVLDYGAQRENPISPGQATELICRAMSAFENHLKWNLFRQEMLPESQWKLLHHLYRIAERAQLERRDAPVGPNGASVAPSQVYAQALLLATMGSGAFNARQVQTASEWLAAWCSGIQVDKQYEAQHHFYFVDLGGGSGARRINGVYNNSDARFLSTDALALQAERSKIAFRQGQVSPSDGIDPIARAGEYAELLDKIYRIWSPEWMRSDQRSHRRVPANNEPIQVVRGLEAICAAATEDHDGGSGPAVGSPLHVDEEYDIKIYGFVREETRAKVARENRGGSSATLRQNWNLVDESVNGYGASLNEGLDNELKLGMVLGIKRAKGPRWAAGYVTRKVHRDDLREVFVGIEVLSHTPIVVTISDLEAGSNTPQAKALFIPGDQGRGRADSLVIDSANFATGRDLLLSARNASYYIRMTRSIRKGQGWQRTAFEVLAKKN